MMLLMHRVHHERTFPSSSLQMLPRSRMKKSILHIAHDGNVSSTITPVKNFDCAVFSLRMPKTGSTSVLEAFIRPLMISGRFTNTNIHPNTCVLDVGGCENYRTIRKNKQNLWGGFPSDVVANATHSQRCSPMKGVPFTLCNEYDANTSTLYIGPHRKQKKTSLPHRSSMQQSYYDFSPHLETHVGFDPTLLGWVLPPRPMIFSAFRDPVQRLLSSFHYGVTFGAGRPGEVLLCALPGVDTLKEWQARVVNARQLATASGDTSVYQQALREYLDACKFANDNVYVQFLDPRQKDVSIAIANLDTFDVIVGLTNDIQGTLKRWTSITLQSCKNHQRIGFITKMLASKERDNQNQRYRKSIARWEPEDFYQDDHEAMQDKPNRRFDTTLGVLDIHSFDTDLQDLIISLTVEDERIYKRVIELYEEQRQWIV